MHSWRRDLGYMWQEGGIVQASHSSNFTPPSPGSLNDSLCYSESIDAGIKLN